MSNLNYIIKKGKGLLNHKPRLCNYSTSLSEEELKKIIKECWNRTTNSHKGREWIIYPPLKD